MKKSLLFLSILLNCFWSIAQKPKTTQKPATTQKSATTTKPPVKQTTVPKTTKTEKPAKIEEPIIEVIERNTQVGNPTYVKVEPTRVYDYNNSDLLVKWHELIFELVEQTQGYSPCVSARNIAYINLAAYESILPVNPENITLSGQLQEFNRPDSLNIDAQNLNASVALNAAVTQPLFPRL